jgi:hypothetical protein
MSLSAQSGDAIPLRGSPLLWPDSTEIHYNDIVIVNGNPFQGTILRSEHGTLYLSMENGVESPIPHAVIDKILFKTGAELLGPTADSAAFYSYFSDPSLLFESPSVEFAEHRLEVETNKHLDRIATTLERMLILQLVLIALGIIIPLTM